MVSCQPLPGPLRGLLYVGGIVGGGIALSLATFAPPHFCIIEPYTTKNFYLGGGCAVLTTVGAGAAGA